MFSMEQLLGRDKKLQFIRIMCRLCYRVLRHVQQDYRVWET